MAFETRPNGRKSADIFVVSNTSTTTQNNDHFEVLENKKAAGGISDKKLDQKPDIRNPDCTTPKPDTTNTTFCNNETAEKMEKMEQKEIDQMILEYSSEKTEKTKKISREMSHQTMTSSSMSNSQNSTIHINHPVVKNSEEAATSLESTSTSSISKSFELKEFRSSTSDVTTTENNFPPPTLAMQTSELETEVFRPETEVFRPETEVLTNNANSRIVQPPPPPPHRVQDLATNSPQVPLRISEPINLRPETEVPPQVPGRTSSKTILKDKRLAPSYTVSPR